MSNISTALERLKQLNLQLDEAIDRTLYETTTGDIIALYDFDGEDEYKGIILFSKDAKIGDVEWYGMNELKEVYVLHN